MVPKLSRALRRPTVEAKQASDPLFAPDVASSADVFAASSNEAIAQSLMIPLVVIVLGVLANENP